MSETNDLLNIKTLKIGAERKLLKDPNVQLE